MSAKCLRQGRSMSKLEIPRGTHLWIDHLLTDMAVGVIGRTPSCDIFIPDESGWFRDFMPTWFECVPDFVRDLLVEEEEWTPSILRHSCPVPSRVPTYRIGLL